MIVTEKKIKDRMLASETDEDISDLTDFYFDARYPGADFYTASKEDFQTCLSIMYDTYLLEYEDNSGSAITDTANIQVGYRSLEYGGECTYSYTPNTLISVDAATLYEDG